MSLSKTKKIFLLITLLFLTVSPVLGGGLVPDDCDGFEKDGVRACTSNDLIGMVVTIFDFIAFTIVPLVAIIGFVVAGIIMITSGGDPGKFNQGKSAMIAIAAGIIVIYLAWTLVSLFITTLGGKTWITTFFKNGN